MWSLINIVAYSMAYVVFWLKRSRIFSGTCEHKLAITDCILNSALPEVYAEIGLACGLYSKTRWQFVRSSIRPVTGTIAYALYIRYRNFSHSAIHPVERKWGKLQLRYIMLVAGGVGWMVHAFSQLMHNKSMK